MSDVTKIRLPDNSELNIKDYRIPGVDTEPTSGSDNVVTSGGVYQDVDDKSFVISTALNDLHSRLNKVENIAENLDVSIGDGSQFVLTDDYDEDQEVVARALNDLNERIGPDGLIFDSIPTENSTHAVTSGGIYNTIIENELSTTAALNDLNDRVSSIENNPSSSITESTISNWGFTKNAAPGTLVSNNTTAQTTSASESLSGTVNLHKVAKTGTYSDLIGTPTIENFYFVQGSSSQAGNATSGSYLSTKWEGTVPGVSTAVNGLKIAYRVATNTGVSTAGVVLSIDSTNYYPVVIQKNTIVTTHYPVGTTVLMVFNSTQTATAYLTSNTKSTVTGCWQIMEYDSNSDTKQREYLSSDNVEYPITTRYATTSGSSYYAEYGRYSEGVTLNPSTNTITAESFKIANGTSSQFLKADGSVDTNIYALASSVPAAQVQSDWNATSGMGVILNKPTIPTAVTESTVSGWGFTKNTGTLTTETDPVFSASAAAGITSSDITNWNGKTSNTGTVTGVKMNGTTKNPTSGVVDLGTVLTSYTETDPTVPSWAKAASKPTYTASEVGALPDTTSIPTESTVSGWGFTKNAAPGTLKTNATTAQTASSGEAMSGTITLHKIAKTGTYSDLIGTPTIPTKVSDLTNDSNFTSNTGTITGITMNGTSKGTSGVVNLGTVLTSETALSKGTTTGSGNAVTDISVSGHQITLTKGSTFLTSHQDISGKANLSGAAFTGTVTGTSSGNTAQFRNVTISSSEPTASDGNNGDIWIVI